MAPKTTEKTEKTKEFEQIIKPFVKNDQWLFVFSHAFSKHVTEARKNDVLDLFKHKLTVEDKNHFFSFVRYFPDGLTDVKRMLVYYKPIGNDQTPGQLGQLLHNVLKTRLWNEMLQLKNDKQKNKDNNDDDDDMFPDRYELDLDHLAQRHGVLFLCMTGVGWDEKLNSFNISKSQQSNIHDVTFKHLIDGLIKTVSEKKKDEQCHFYVLGSPKNIKYVNPKNVHKFIIYGWDKIAIQDSNSCDRGSENILFGDFPWLKKKDAER